MTPDEALERLLIGNRRYAAMNQIHPRQTRDRRELLVDGQAPFAAVLSCSDSRVPSELIFDQGLGDLFIVRTAGHAVGEQGLASLEYAVHALHVPLIMVVGHANCGAVTAVMQALELPGFLPSLAEYLRPAIEGVDAQADDALRQAIHANSRLTAQTIRQRSHILREATEKGDLRISAAYYDLHTGVVTLLA